MPNLSLREEAFAGCCSHGWKVLVAYIANVETIGVAAFYLTWHIFVGLIEMFKIAGQVGIWR